MATPTFWAGASGYAFKEWKGNFYREKIQPEPMLACYAERLPSVEINSTFYQMPKVEVLERWAETTPEAFSFAIKASKRITHVARLAADAVAYLYKNLASLGAKRGPVLFQTPPFLKKDAARLQEVLQLLPAGPHDLAGAGAVAPAGRARPGLRRLARCSRRASRPTSVVCICQRSIFRCCSCKARATSWRRWSCRSRWCNGWVNGRRWRCSKTPTIRSTSERAAAEWMARRWRQCSTRRRAGHGAQAAPRPAPGSKASEATV
jgi:hypothetical protein